MRRAHVDDVGAQLVQQARVVGERTDAPQLPGLAGQLGVDVAHADEFGDATRLLIGDRVEVDPADRSRSDDRDPQTHAPQPATGSASRAHS